jgi:hypothetical protein
MRAILATLIVLAGGVAGAQTTTASASRPAQTQRADSLLRLVQTIPMPGVRGRLGHMAIDLRHQQLFVAASGNNTVEVLDLAAGKRLKSVRGFGEPRAIAYLPAQDLLVVTSGWNGLMQFLHRSSLKEIDRYQFQADADLVRYEPALGQIFVGYGDGAIACFDAGRRNLLMDFSLGGHPGAFEVETRGKRVFINVPDDRHGPLVKVLLRREGKPWAHLDDWRLTYGKGNYAMALDERHGRLFVACREPGMLLAMDTETGKIVDYTPIGGDVDDIFWDEAARRLYISCGAGTLDVVRQEDANHYRMIERVTTAPGARTCLFVPQTRRLYVAVPAREQQPAEVRVYEAANGRG